MPVPPITAPHLSLSRTPALTGASAAEPTSVQKTAPNGTRKDPFVEFEAFVLQSFVEAILPKDAETVFGGGLAGGYWKSMLAETLGKELAEHGGIGIAKMIASGKTGASPEKT
jgi:hypothetical protein